MDWSDAFRLKNADILLRMSAVQAVLYTRTHFSEMRFGNHPVDGSTFSSRMCLRDSRDPPKIWGGRDQDPCPSS